VTGPLFLAEWMDAAPALPAAPNAGVTAVVTAAVRATAALPAATSQLFAIVMESP
jgi:hypothetical protein